MRIIGGILLGLALFFPGITLLRWVGEDLLGYQEMTMTDGCLVMIIILLSVVIVTRLRLDRSREQSPRSRREVAASEQPSPYSRTSSAASRSRRPASRSRRDTGSR